MNDTAVQHYKTMNDNRRQSVLSDQGSKINDYMKSIIEKTLPEYQKVE